MKIGRRTLIGSDGTLLGVGDKIAAISGPKPFLLPFSTAGVAVTQVLDYIHYVEAGCKSTRERATDIESLRVPL